MTTQLRDLSKQVIRGGQLVTGGNAPPDWAPNWIDYRSSLANVDRRQARGDTVTECAHCECETDITPAPHSPTCPSLKSAVWDRAAIAVAIRAWATGHGGDAPVKDDWHTETVAHPTGKQVLDAFGKWNDALAYAGFTANTPRKRGRLHPDHVEGLDLLEQLDAGVRIAPPALEEVPVGAAAAGTSSNTAAEEGEPEHRVSEPPAAAEDGGQQSVPGSPPEPQVSRRGRPPKWSRDSAIAWMREHATDGLALSANDCVRAGGPSHSSIQRMFGSWRSYIEATGLAARPSGVRKTRLATTPGTGEGDGARRESLSRPLNDTRKPGPDGEPLGVVLRRLLAAVRETLDAFERELEVKTDAEAGQLIRLVVRRIGETA